MNKEYETLKPVDFNAKWNSWLKEIDDVKNEIEIISEESTSFGKIVKFYFMSVKNTKIYAMLYYVNENTFPRPIVAYYHGHNSNIDAEHNIWHCMNLVNAGCSVVIMDMRFQNGGVIDPNHYNYDTYPSSCYNIDDIENCYAKRLCQDAIKMVDVIKDKTLFPEFASSPLITAGPSQGGGLSLMVASMRDVKLVLSDIPSDCAIKMRIMGKYGKYGVIKDFINANKDLEKLVLANQDYFDVINMAENIKGTVVSSVGLDDNICPAQFYKLAYEKLNCEKYIYEYPGFGHGGFEELHLPVKIKHLYEMFPYLKN